MRAFLCRLYLLVDDIIPNEITSKGIIVLVLVHFFHVLVIGTHIDYIR